MTILDDPTRTLASAKIVKAMEESGMSHHDLANKIEVTYTGVNRILRADHGMRLRTFYKICKALHVSPNTLLGWYDVDE